MCRPRAESHGANTSIQAADPFVSEDTRHRVANRAVHPSARAARPHQLRIDLRASPTARHERVKMVREPTRDGIFGGKLRSINALTACPYRP